MEVIHLYPLPPNGWRQELMTMMMMMRANSDIHKLKLFGNNK